MHLEFNLAWICLIHLLFFAAVLWSKKTNKKANRVLSFFMLSMAAIHFSHLLIITHVVAKVHYLNELGMISVFLVGPLYLHYVSCISDIKVNWKKYLILHLLPIVPALVWSFSFYFKSDSEILTYYENALIKQPLDGTILTSIATVQMGFYLIWSVRLINRYSINLKRGNNNDLLNLKWLQAITISLLVVTYIISPLMITLANDDAKVLYIYFPIMTMIIYATIFLKSINLPDAEVEKKRVRKQERESISRDMHDDLGSGLSKISFISSNLKGQLHLDKESMKQVEKISQASRDLVNNMGHLIWSVNSENDTLDSLLAYIREYTVGFLDDYNLKSHINFPETNCNIILSPEQRRNVFLVIKESLNNIVKHASAKQVWIDIHISSNSMKIIIKDDGKGFECESSHTGNGLKNMQYRMEQSEGNYKIKSCIGKGSSTTLSLLFK